MKWSFLAIFPDPAVTSRALVGTSSALACASPGLVALYE
jgi:hypothetical protein